MRPSPIALVTGANRGIGREVCRQLAANRMRVLIGARDPAKGEAAALEMARGGFNVEAVALDVTDAASIQALGDKLGAVDVLINNAGVDYDTDQTPISADREQRRREPGVYGARAARLQRLEGGAQRAHPVACRRAGGDRRSRQQRLPGLGGDRYGRPGWAPRARRRRKRRLGGDAARRRTDRRLLPRWTADCMVSGRVTADALRAYSILMAGAKVGGAAAHYHTPITIGRQHFCSRRAIGKRLGRGG
jgi:hypothetical protein